MARPALCLVILAATLVNYASASSQHTMTWLVEERGFDFQAGAFLSAAIVLVAGLGGNLGIGALTDRATQHRPGARLVALAALSVFGLAAVFLFYWLPPDSSLFYPAWILAQAWLLGWIGPVVAAVGEMAPAGSARASSASASWSPPFCAARPGRARGPRAPRSRRPGDGPASDGRCLRSTEMVWNPRPLYSSELDVERGPFVGVSRGPVELTVYAWNLDGEAPYAVVALGLDF